MFKLVLPTLAVLSVLYSAVTGWRLWAMRGRPKRRTWAVFVAGRPKGLPARRLRRRVQSADPTGVVAVYRLRDHAGLAEGLGVDRTPAIVLGDGQGGAKVTLAGRDAIRTYLRRRTSRTPPAL